MVQLYDFLLECFDYRAHMNAGVELTEGNVAKGFGDNTTFIGNAARSLKRTLC
jgi:2-aminobenzoate-CoA ligase